MGAFTTLGYDVDLSRSGKIVVPGMGRNGLYDLMREMGCKTGCEVGVEAGRNAAAILERIPDCHLILVDPYGSSPWSTNKRYSERHFRHMKQRARRRLGSKTVSWIEERSEIAHQEIEDLSLDFVYIDGDHQYDSVMLDIILYSRKVRNGGVVAGHDYDKRKARGVMRAVDDYVRRHRIRQWFLTSRDIPNRQKGDEIPSWFWIKR